MAQEIPKSLIDVRQNYSSSASFSYYIDFKINYLDGDSSRFKASCFIDRNTNDEFFGMNFWVEFDNGNIVYYNGKELKKSNYSQKEITVYYGNELRSFPFKSSRVEDALKTGFIENKFFSGILNSENSISSFTEDTIDQNNIQIKVVFNDDPPFSNLKKLISINGEKNIIERFESHIEFNNEFQEIKWTISEANVNDLNNLNHDSLFKSKTWNFSLIKINSDEIKLKPLVANDPCPLFEGHYLKNSKKFNSGEISSKYVLLDFSFIDCPPCKQIIPELNGLYTKYNRELLSIYSLNSIDNSDVQVEKLRNYVIQNDVLFQTILVSQEVDSAFGVKHYPTLFLIDSEGKILYTSIGVNNDTFNEMHEFIK